MTPLLSRRLSALPAGAKVLDAGGWFNPCLAATHIVDLMPYETRRGQLDLKPSPGERFSKATWHQAEFLRADLRLPFPDGFFDFSLCTQTIEDLTDPSPLLRELERVSRAGYVESPSRLAEQTTGVRDRITSRPGHPHHHWIADVTDGVLELSAKSALGDAPGFRYAVPLSVYERITQAEASAALCQFTWERRLAFRQTSPEEARRRAAQLHDSLDIRPLVVWHDWLLRALRCVKWRGLRKQQDDPTGWWQEMLRLSRPYSTIPL